MSTVVITHGTYAGYKQERRSGLDPCDACREAMSRYNRDYRASTPGVAARDAASSTARNAALEALRLRHPEEFAVLYEAEREKAAITPLPMERPCACGGVIRRKRLRGPWPRKCDTCRGIRGDGEA